MAEMTQFSQVSNGEYLGVEWYQLVINTFIGSTNQPAQLTLERM